MYSAIHSLPLDADFQSPLDGTNLPGDACLVLTTDPKPRLRWTAELHERFVDAVTQLGGPDSNYSAFTLFVFLMLLLEFFLFACKGVFFRLLSFLVYIYGEQLLDLEPLCVFLFLVFFDLDYNRGSKVCCFIGLSGYLVMILFKYFN